MAGQETQYRWIPIDPCEASVDEPLLYESWGKNQTYIIAFSDSFCDKYAFSLTTARLKELAVSEKYFPNIYASASSYVVNTSTHFTYSELNSKFKIDGEEEHMANAIDVTHLYTSNISAALDRRKVTSDEFEVVLNKLRLKMKNII